MNCQRRVEGAANLLDRRQELRQAFEGEEFALQRHHHRIGGGERVDGEQIERRRAIDQHIGGGVRIVGARGAVASQRVAQFIGAVGVAGDFQLDPEQVHGRRRDGEARHRGRHGDVAQGFFPDQHLVARGDAGFAVDAEPGRGVALRVEVDDENPLADRGQRGSEVDGGGGLADPALLVRHDEDARARSGVGLANEGLGRGHGAVSASANAQDRGLGVDGAG